jgi:hypothetical protein
MLRKIEAFAAIAAIACHLAASAAFLTHSPTIGRMVSGATTAKAVTTAAVATVSGDDYDGERALALVVPYAGVLARTPIL